MDKIKIVAEFVKGDDPEDKICYLFLESEGKVSLTIEGADWSLLLPFTPLRSFLHRASQRPDVRQVKTGYSIAPEEVNPPLPAKKIEKWSKKRETVQVAKKRKKG